MMFSRGPEPSYNFWHFLGILTLMVTSLTGFPGLPISLSSTFLYYPLPHIYTCIYLAAAEPSVPSFNSPNHYRYQVISCNKLLPKFLSGNVCMCMCYALAQDGWDAENEIRPLDNFKVADILPTWIVCWLTLLPVSLVSSDISGFPSPGSSFPLPITHIVFITKMFPH